jgi:branched-subunit amino acid aminotransferase/4-amino-4-deoxychorismate lyase
MTAACHVVLDGVLMARHAARIACDDRGLLLGDGIFTTLRVLDGVALFLDRHVARLQHNAAALGIDAQAAFGDAQGLAGQVQMLLAAEAEVARSARLRITMTRGVATPTLLITLDAWHPEPAYANGVAIELSAQVRIAHPLHTIKSTSYAAHAWLRREATQVETFDVLQANDRGNLAEGSFNNVFVVDAAGVLRTPHPADGCLPGITRGVVLELAQELAAGSLREGAVEAASLAAAREMFLTSSLNGIVPVRTLDRQALPQPCPGPVTVALRAAYAARIRAWVAAQAAGLQGPVLPTRSSHVV